MDLRHVLAFALALTSACGEDDPAERAGARVFSSSAPLATAQVADDAGLLVVFEERAPSPRWHALRVDRGTAEVTSLPPPPLPAGAAAVLGHARAPTEAVVGVVRGRVVEISALAAGAWTALPPPSLDATGLELTQLLAHDGRTYATVGGHLLVWDGAAWSEPAQGSSVVLGGFSGDVQWAIVNEGDPFTMVRLERGMVAASLDGGQGLPVPSAVNGDAARFQFFLGGTMCRSDAGAVQCDSPAAHSPFTAPGSPRVVGGDGTPTSGYLLYEDARERTTLLAPFAPVIDDDPIDYVRLRPGPDASWMGMVVVNEEDDGQIGMRVRFLDLPFAGDPFAP